MAINQAVILAGGLGTRLRPITYEIPKALIPVHGRTITEHLFDLLKRYGITNIIMSVGYMKEKIEAYFLDGSQFGLNISYIEEEKPLGTAGPLKLARKGLKETFVCMNGDELKNVNIDEMYEVHKRNKALATLALVEVMDPSLYGVARLDGNKIMEFIEKPKKEKAHSNFINSGFYILEPEVISLIPETKNGFAMLEKDVFPKIAEMGRLYAYKSKGQWFDTGNMERYEKAIKEWEDIKVE